MKIKRSDFRKLGTCPDRVSYIKEKQPLVRDVYCDSIYFQDSFHYIAWSFKHTSDKVDDMFLRAINAACNTEFEFEEGEDL